MIKFLALSTILIFSSPVEAEFSLEIHGLSQHFGTSQKFNERNTGIGAKLDNLSLGVYHNSLYQQSVYFSWSYEENLTESLVVGLDLGLVTGYNDDVSPFVVPIISIRTTEITFLKFRMLPAVPNIVPMVVSASLVVKF